MNPASVARVITHPVHTAGSLAGRTIGVTLGAARVGVRTTARVVGWAVERAGGPAPQHPTTYDYVTVPSPAPRAAADLGDLATSGPSDDPVRATVTPPRKASARSGSAKKVPASEVPLKSAPTPSLPAGVEALDDAVDDSPAPARKTAAKKPAKKPAKKATARKPAAKKAPSEQAAVLAPALGLSETEVAEVLGDDG